MPAPGEVRRLVARFHENRASYVSGRYNETQLRREFVDPFFTALGWDVATVQGYAEAYKDVVHEDAIVIGGLVHAPDYCFRVGGARKFFVQTKRPAVKIRDDAAAAFQLRRYAWSAKLPLSILTNFAELAVYDCRVKPDRSDPASTARILYFTCDEYDARWDELAEIFTLGVAWGRVLQSHIVLPRRGLSSGPVHHQSSPSKGLGGSAVELFSVRTPLF